MFIGMNDPIEQTEPSRPPSAQARNAPVSVGVILASVREGRKGEAIAKWILELLTQQADAAPELLDLRDYQAAAYQLLALPVHAAEKKLDEGAAARRWLERITALDAFVIVTPEYNRGYPGALKNALDSVHSPWNDKPVAFVSYGYSTAGARAADQLRQVTMELRMIPIRDEVNLRLGSYKTDDRDFPADDLSIKRGGDVVRELLFWGHLLQDGRQRRRLGSTLARGD